MPLPAMPYIAEELEAAGERFADALGAVSDPSAPAGSLDWTVHELGAHLATGVAGYASMARGAPTHLTSFASREVAGAAAIARESATPDAELAERVRQCSHDFAGHLRRLAPDEPLPFYDSTLPAAVIGGLVLGELVVHSWDLAKMRIHPAPQRSRAPRPCTSCRSSCGRAPRQRKRRSASACEVTWTSPW